jgi:hypothetical protein
MHAQTLRVHGWARAHGCSGVPLTSKRPRGVILAPARAQALSPPLPSLPPPSTPPVAATAAPPPPEAAPPVATPAAPAAAPTPQEQVDILYAGYADVAERLKEAHARLERLEQTRQEPPPPPPPPPFAAASPPWDAALFLLFFLAFINFAGFLALWQAQSAIAAAGPPWWAALAPGGAGLSLAGAAAAASTRAPVLALVLKKLVLLFVPLTNTAVVLTFCAAAVKAALACLRAWE